MDGGCTPARGKHISEGNGGDSCSVGSAPGTWPSTLQGRRCGQDENMYRFPGSRHCMVVWSGTQKEKAAGSGMRILG